jgi:hypothetical protein
MGGQVLLASYTVSHARSQLLSETLSAFLAAQRAMAGNRPYKRLTATYGLAGSIKALEVTWGALNGWHPHCHTLLFAPTEIFLPALEEELYVAWLASARRQGLSMNRQRGLQLVVTHGRIDEYVAKWGHGPTRRLWGAEDELTKANSKRGRYGPDGQRGHTPFDLLRWLADTGESQPIALFREYAGVFKGRRQLVWSPGLRVLLGAGEERSDEALAGEVREDGILLATLSPAEWVAVRGRGLRGELLEVARAGDPDELATFVADICADYYGVSREYLLNKI